MTRNHYIVIKDVFSTLNTNTSIQAQTERKV